MFIFWLKSRMYVMYRELFVIAIILNIDIKNLFISLFLPLINHILIII